MIFLCNKQNRLSFNLRAKIEYMKKNILLIAGILCLFVASCESGKKNSHQSAKIFKEIGKIVEEDNERFWGMSYATPILFVDIESGKLYGNEPDKNGCLKKDKNKVYTCDIPDDLPIANTSVQWGGKDWAMVVLPLPEQVAMRDRLILHEMFHVLQTRLGFTELWEQTCAHLDTKEGRISIRLELQALLRAIENQDDKEVMSVHLRNALSIRNSRYKDFPEAKSQENIVELKEGMAEYTALMMTQLYSKDPIARQSIPSYFGHNGDILVDGSGLARSFAYETIAMYGYALHEITPGWHRDITRQSNLTDTFTKLLAMDDAEFSFVLEDKYLDTYHYNTIMAEECVREEALAQTVVDIKERFLGEGRIRIPAGQFNISFNPFGIVQIVGTGTFYTSVRITDAWGTLSSEEGILFVHETQSFFLPSPSEVGQGLIKGDGWELNLNDDWMLERHQEGWYEVKQNE